jgi:NhaP-type Na+/H+ or K+/H+ antiporter
VDLLWAIFCGAAVGWLLGVGTGRLVLYLRRVHREAVGLDDFLALGLIGLSYGLAVLLHGYGFIAVFAAGLALVRAECALPEEPPSSEISAGASVGREEAATDERTAPAYMASAVLGFTEQLEHIAEVVLMLIVGALLARVGFSVEGFIFAAALMFVLRPVAVALTTAGADATGYQRALLCWFGIRGIGSVYYLFFAVNHGLPPAISGRLIPIVLTVIASSAVLHGISVTPLMRRYQRRGGSGADESSRRPRPPSPAKAPQLPLGS